MGRNLKITHLLLLELSIIRDERCQLLVDTAFLEEAFKLFLETNVQCIELKVLDQGQARDAGDIKYLRSQVKTTALEVSFGSQLSANLLVGVVGHVLNNK